MTTRNETVCRCICPLHAGRRWNPNDRRPGCTCSITCNRLPLTLIARAWGCVILLDNNDVVALPYSNNELDWDNLAEIDSRSQFYNAGRDLAAHLAEIDHALSRPIE